MLENGNPIGELQSSSPVDWWNQGFGVAEIKCIVSERLVVDELGFMVTVYNIVDHSTGIVRYDNNHSLIVRWFDISVVRWFYCSFIKKKTARKVRYYQRHPQETRIAWSGSMTTNWRRCRTWCGNEIRQLVRPGRPGPLMFCAMSICMLMCICIYVYLLVYVCLYMFYLDVYGTSIHILITLKEPCKGLRLNSSIQMEGWVRPSKFWVNGWNIDW